MEDYVIKRLRDWRGFPKLQVHFGVPIRRIKVGFGVYVGGLRFRV